MRTIRASFIASLLFLLCGAVFAAGQYGQGNRNRDRDGYYQDQHSNSRFYRDGLRDGREDRARRRPVNYRYSGRGERQRQDYIAGYREGYGSGYLGRDRDHDDARY